MTTPTSLELREYNTNKDTQLPILEPTPEALIPTPEPTPAAVDSPPAPDTGKQPTIIDDQTDQPEPDKLNLVNELINTSVHPCNRS